MYCSYDNYKFFYVHHDMLNIPILRGREIKRKPKIKLQYLMLVCTKFECTFMYLTIKLKIV